MARQLSVGFETNSLSDKEAPTWSQTGSNMSIVTSPVRTGTYAAESNPAGGSANYITLSNSSDHSQFFSSYINIGTLPSAASSIVMFLNGGIALCYIDLQSNGTFTLRYSDSGGGQTQLGSASAAISTGAYHCLELHIDDTGGVSSVVVEARLDGTVFATGTVALFAGSAVPNGQILFGDGLFESTTSGVWYWDDMVLNDSSGTNETSYPSTGHKLIIMRPNATGDKNTFATQTGGTAGAANNYTRVNEVTPDDATTFNGSNTLNQEDLFKCAASGIGVNDTVNVVHVMARVRNSVADATTTLKLEIEKAAAGTIAQGTGITPNTTTWATKNFFVTYKDPNSNAWTKTTLDTMQIGYKLTTGGTNRIDVSNVFAYVDYTPGVAAVVPLSTRVALTGAGL